jgi:uncharacterized membrane protein YgcG
MEIRVQFPHGIISGSPAPWQAAFDERRQFEETERPRFDLVTLLVSALILIGGPAAAVVLYNTRGRDPNVGLVADYLTEPPDVPPGVAGALIDETADMQDVVATLIDLARRGVLKMKEQPIQALGGALTVNDWVFAPGDQFGKAALRPFERELVDALQLQQGEKALSSLKNKFYQHLPTLKAGLYRELVADGYYNRSPETTRSSYGALAMALAVLAILSVCVATVFLGDLTRFSICIPIGLGATALAFFAIARAMPARTRKGADIRMRAEAFKRYLQNIEKYTDLKESKDQFEKYLPYAVAFGLEHSWTNKFVAVDAPMPPWYVPVWPRPYYGPAYGRRGPVIAAAGAGQVLGRLEPRGDVGDAARTGGGIEGMERSLAGGIGSLEGGLASMFDSVSNTFGSRPAPSNPSRGGWSGGRSGGGFSGGGSGGGGSSGGGGGGFG